MKTYNIFWENFNCVGEDHLTQNYDASGNLAGKIGQQPFETDNIGIARKVFQQEIASIPYPLLSTMPWAAGGLKDNDEAYGHVWTLRLTMIETDDEGDIVDVSDVECSEKFYFGE